MTGPEVAEEHTGAMVALYPPSALAAELAVEGGLPPEELHVTLAFLGKAADLDAEVLHRVVAGFATTVTALSASVNGIGVFTSSHLDTPVTWASIDVPALPSARERLVELLTGAGIPVADDHGFTPHMTLIYADRRDLQPATKDLTFDQIWVVTAGERKAYPFTGVPKAQLSVAEPAPFDLGALVLPTPQEARAMLQNTFVAEVGNKTVLTAPVASVRPQRTSDNPHFLWIDGAYVGSEEPNRNGAMWTTADLEFGAPSVAHGPLNWHHDGHHIVGAITDAQMIYPPQTAGEGRDDHLYIRTLAAMWTWLFPEEAQLVEQAAEWGKLWLSMECISESVSCAGANGCGASYPYMELIKGKACQHLLERSSVRRLENPTFLGSALILPPARPGWAHAKADVKIRAAAMAERTFDEAGHPDVTASEWERLMQEVISAAEST